MRDSLRATLSRAVSEGAMELDKAYVDYRNYLTTDKIPYELTDEMSGADKQQMPETKQVLELLNRMTESVTDTKTRAHLRGRLDRLRERLGVSDERTTVDTDAVNALLPDEALEEVAKQMGNGMTVERLRRAMRKAKRTKGHHGHTILVDLNDEDDGDDNDNMRGEDNG
jgi:hypothetical protein